MSEPPAATLFRKSIQAVSNDVPIRFRSASDKEYGFQDWVRDRLKESGLPFTAGGRNSYPDFRLLQHAEGFEVKSLRTPGRTASMDTNSQPPGGFHDGVIVYYVFGRHRREPATSLTGLLDDLVIFHGDVIDPSRDYVHKNKSVPTFGRFGDVMIRDRKMYVPKTPHQIVDGLDGALSLILPAAAKKIRGLTIRGTLTRHELDSLVKSYSFDLNTNELRVRTRPNPDAGKAHTFNVYRPSRALGPSVRLRS